MRIDAGRCGVAFPLLPMPQLYGIPILNPRDCLAGGSGLTTDAMCVTMLHMKTATVREVQHHLSKVLAWVEKGEEVQVTRRNKTVARLVPSGPANPAPVSLPDFAARARAIWGAQPKGSGLSKTILNERKERL